MISPLDILWQIAIGLSLLMIAAELQQGRQMNRLRPTALVQRCGTTDRGGDAA